MVLQILCNEVLNYEEIRADFDTKEEYMVFIEQDISTGVASDSAPTLFHPRYVKTPTFKEREAIEI